VAKLDGSNVILGGPKPPILGGPKCPKPKIFGGIVIVGGVGSSLELKPGLLFNSFYLSIDSCHKNLIKF